MIDPYVQVRPEVIAALGRMRSGGSSLDARANAARAIGILRGRQAIPDLEEALRSKDTELIYESLVAMREDSRSERRSEACFSAARSERKGAGHRDRGHRPVDEPRRDQPICATFSTALTR